MDRTAVLIRREDKFLLTKNEEEDYWSPVMATVERGETLRETARRETRNGADVEVEFVEKISRTDLDDEGTQLHWYLAEEKPADEEEGLEAEEVETNEIRKWFELDELDQVDLAPRSRSFFEEHLEELKE